jgi:N-methylhydantoinase B/oxoprolinase/acetone carboxylase alpha subunit
MTTIINGSSPSITFSDSTTQTTAGLTGSTSQLCKAWVNFTGSSGTINSSYNCSSITRNGAGDYTFNFATSLSSQYYSITGCCKPTSSQTNTSYGRSVVIYYNTTPSTSSFRFLTITSATVGPEDYDQVYITVHGA